MFMNYLLPMARCLETGQTVKQQDLKGVKYDLAHRREAELMAEQLADSMQRKTGRTWSGFLKPYTPTARR